MDELLIIRRRGVGIIKKEELMSMEEDEFKTDGG